MNIVDTKILNIYKCIYKILNNGKDDDTLYYGMDYVIGVMYA